MRLKVLILIFPSSTYGHEKFPVLIGNPQDSFAGISKCKLFNMCRNNRYQGNMWDCKETLIALALLVIMTEGRRREGEPCISS